MIVAVVFAAGGAHGGKAAAAPATAAGIDCVLADLAPADRAQARLLVIGQLAGAEATRVDRAITMKIEQCVSRNGWEPGRKRPLGSYTGLVLMEEAIAERAPQAGVAPEKVRAYFDAHKAQIMEFGRTMTDAPVPRDKQETLIAGLREAGAIARNTPTAQTVALQLLANAILQENVRAAFPSGKAGGPAR